MEKNAKNPQKLTLFQKNDLNFAISKFSKYFKHTFFYKIYAQLEVNFRNKFQKKLKYRNKDRGKKPHKINTISNLSSIDRYTGIGRMSSVGQNKATYVIIV